MDDRESYIEHKKAALAALKEKLKEAQDAREAAQSQAAVLREQVESLKQHMVNTNTLKEAQDARQTAEDQVAAIREKLELLKKLKGTKPEGEQ